jgi:hypothetical protein
MKPLWLIFLLLTTALAHPLSGTGPVQGDLRFEPLDQPKAKVPLVAYLDYVSLFEIKVNLMECRCTLMAYEGAAKPDVQPKIVMPFGKKNNRLEGKLTFPKPGLYMIVVLGRPEPGSKLAPFMLTSMIEVN